MLKKGIAAAALIAAASSVYAGGPEAPPPAYIGGAYVDVGLSRDDLYDNFRRGIVNDTLARRAQVRQVRTRDYRYNSGAPGWDGFVGFGYNYVWDNEWSLGFELFGDVSSANGRQFDRNSVLPLNIAGAGASLSNYIDLRAKYTLGVSLMPGYFVAPGSLYFLEMGYVNTEFSVTGFPAPLVGQFGNGALNDLGANPSRQLNQSGFRLGFGTNTQVGSHVAIRQEYVWETYGNFTVQRDFVRADNAAQLQTNSSTVRVSPSISKFNLAAVYYFARQGNAPDLNTAPAHIGGHFYAGLNGSYDEFYSQAEERINRLLTNADGSVVNADSFADGARLKGLGWNIGLLGGYGWNFSNRWYLGGEVFGNYDNVRGRLDNTSTTVTTANGATVTDGFTINTRLQKNWDFGAALIPGYQVSDHALLYARVGYVGGDFNIRNFWSGTTGRNAEQNALLSYSRSKWCGGLQLGVGVDTLVYENLSLRTEFNINNYGNYAVTTPLAPLGTDVFQQGRATSVAQTTSYRHIIEDQFNVALIWHFFG